MYLGHHHQSVVKLNDSTTSSLPLSPGHLRPTESSLALRIEMPMSGHPLRTDGNRHWSCSGSIELQPASSGVRRRTSLLLGVVLGQLSSPHKRVQADGRGPSPSALLTRRTTGGCLNTLRSPSGQPYCQSTGTQTTSCLLPVLRTPRPMSSRLS